MSLLKRIFGGDDEPDGGDPNARVTIRVEVDGKTYVQRYADLDMAQIRFPQYLADLNATHQPDDERAR